MLILIQTKEADYFAEWNDYFIINSLSLKPNKIIKMTGSIHIFILFFSIIRLDQIRDSKIEAFVRI